jgi:branched-chain amino acid transport system permease protein
MAILRGSSNMTSGVLPITRGGLIFDRSNIPLLLLPLIPLVVKDFYYLQILDTIGIYVIFSMSINILLGFMGQISFGQAGFWGIGAYTSALLSTKLGFPFWLCLICALVSAGVFGFLVGLPSLRLRGSYLALATLSFGLIIQMVLLRWAPFTNGPNGINDIAPASFFGVTFNTETRFYYLLLFFLVLLHIFCKHLRWSRIGYAMQSVRINETSSTMAGIDITKIKLLGFVISAVIAGLSGSLLAHFMGYIAPEIFSVDASIIVLTIMVLGGSGTFSGPWLGSVLIVGSSEYLRFLGHYREVAYGIVIVLVIIFMPEGLHGWFSKIAKRIRRITSNVYSGSPEHL